MFLCGQAADRLFAHAFCLDFFFNQCSQTLLLLFVFLFLTHFFGFLLVFLLSFKKEEGEALCAVVVTGMAGAVSLSDLSYKDERDPWCWCEMAAAPGTARLIPADSERSAKSS